MKFLVEVKNDEFIQPDDWKKLNSAKKDIETYIRLRGYKGKLEFELDSLGGDLYVTLDQSSTFRSLDSLVNELNRSIPGFLFDAEED